MKSRIYHYISRILDWLYRQFARINPKLEGLILMYHEILASGCDSNDPCLCSFKIFEQTLTELQRKGYRILSIDEAIDAIKTGRANKFAVITFDDISNTVFTVAYPFLKRMNMPFTVYITLNYLDKPKFITRDQLDILAHDPLCTIGCHTISHSKLRYSNRKKKEIFQSKILLEKLIKKPVVHFAYPYGKIGAVDFQSIQMTKRAGYRSAVGTIEAPLSCFSKYQLWYLPRVVIN